MNKLLLLAAFAATLVAAQPPPATTDAETAIDQLRTGLVDSFFKGDIERALTFLSPDVVVTWQNGEVSHGPQEVRAYYQRMMTGPERVVRDVRARPEVQGRRVHGDWAVSWGVLNDEFELTDGRHLALGSRFTITTARHGDRWLVTSYHASVNAFDNAVLDVALGKVGTWAGVGGLVAGALIGLIAGRFLGRPRAPTA